VLLQRGIRGLEGEARQISQDMIVRYAPLMNANATVFVGSGLVVSAGRAIVIAQKLISRGSYPDKTFSNVSEAVTWLLAQMGRAREDHPALLNTALSIIRKAEPGFADS